MIDKAFQLLFILLSLGLLLVANRFSPDDGSRTMVACAGAIVLAMMSSHRTNP